ncbi:RAD55 family ATPase [Haloparvum sedimenti]|uniref:RAD55 family ATPase n=1 Tax=Haloparvum sedimenti TaxID=1678448 RepID=UPI00071E998F|nr:hypothetical protein [Haloparvum sedimenti]
MTRLSTGVPILDRRLDGGLVPGSTVALVAPPESQSELLATAFAAAGPTLYLTTLRPERSVRKALTAAGVEDVTVRQCDAETLATDPASVLRDLPTGGRVVIGVMNPLERMDRQRGASVVSAVSDAVEAEGGAALLHCLEGSGLDDGRVRTLALADVVCSLELSHTSLSIDNRLHVTKFRNGAALTEPIKVKLADAVEVDTSRDIA